MQKIKFSLNLQTFPLEAVYLTCYNFIDRVYIYLDKKGDNILVSFKSKEGSKINPRTLEGEFRNELLHNTLRIKIAQNNAKIREYIISQAVCSSLALPTETPPTDLALPSEQIQERKTGEGYSEGYSYVEDPLGIAIPWEEKIKMQQKKKKEKRKQIVKKVSPKRLKKAFKNKKKREK
jgi:His-Xaa-Ser system protein HxsD